MPAIVRGPPRSIEQFSEFRHQNNGLLMPPFSILLGNIHSRRICHKEQLFMADAVERWA
ncbi:hypothetical protein [Deinococcus soli (ex Cha et al. 2016)]|uniref:Uncharacterized protein n=2 Tax=Deinococcus soli (ex Cha et al. 2016) TaxID=1309411 RepID=A0AAE3XFA7_9DEIO|nr:hypothetical protein [Deinococcus soli (ex Cha et al. 2016)]MDR6219899.1 hypothetical protein [Deinococcus soli (ex Cha et al. 2016)]MDR6329843.1 hypothetical protein [Deinococcus soli (ex Cha et al. 2016)]MDR6752806.1 hypothetical protein [Deinococcus soli (ex Cha et al. 2016)]